VDQSPREAVSPHAEQGANIVAFAPWVIYWIVADGPSTWFYGALCAWLAAFMVGVSIGMSRLKPLDILTLVFFAAVTIVGAVVGAHDRDWMDTYSMTLSGGVLAVFAFSSLAFVPLTEQYARDTVSPGLWDDPEFKQTHRVLTLIVGSIFLSVAVLGYIAVRAPATSDWTDWVIPIALLIGGARVLQTYPQMARARAARPRPA
jgi:hypothetical protein